MSIRFAAASDCAAMLAIYAPYIETTITFMQAFIFCMLTMMFISTAAE